MLQRSIRWLAGVALFFSMSPTLAAQTVASPYRYLEEGQAVGIFVGYHDPGRARFGFGPGGGPSFGARYAVEATGPLAVEGVATFVSSSRRVIDPTLAESDWVLGEVPAELFFLDLRLRMSLTGRRTWHGLAPHILVGGGLGVSVQGLQPLDGELEPGDRFLFGNKFTPMAGAGVRYHVRERWSVRVDGTLTLYRIDTPEGFRDPVRGFEGVEEREWISNPGLSLGLSYHF